jgi:hypothetical protein
MMVTTGCQQSYRHEQQEADATKHHGRNSSLHPGRRGTYRLPGAHTIFLLRSSFPGGPKTRRASLSKVVIGGGRTWGVPCAGRLRERRQPPTRVCAVSARRQSRPGGKAAKSGPRLEDCAGGVEKRTRSGATTQTSPGVTTPGLYAHIIPARATVVTAAGARPPRHRGPAQGSRVTRPGSTARAGSTVGPKRPSAGSRRGSDGRCRTPSSPARPPGPGRRTAGAGSSVSLLFFGSGFDPPRFRGETGRHRTASGAVPPGYGERSRSSILFSPQELFLLLPGLDSDACGECCDPAGAARSAHPAGRTFLAAGSAGA